MPNSSNEICFMRAVDILDSIRQKKLSAREVMQAHLQQINRGIPKVNAMVTLVPEDRLMAQHGEGDALLAQKDWEDALMAYLHVPVFYQDEKIFLPPALLGSGRAYRRLNDNNRAKRALKELIATFPQSAEANAAQAELKKL